METNDTIPYGNQRYDLDYRTFIRREAAFDCSFGVVDGQSNELIEGYEHFMYVVPSLPISLSFRGFL